MLSQVHELKGKQDLFKNQSREVLEALRQTAIIQSTESSNRIEGITAPPERIIKLAQDKTTPRNRSEQEIYGYRSVLDTIHANYAQIPIKENTLLQFHRDLYAFAGGQGGKYKPVQNYISREEPEGTKAIIFTPPAPGVMTETAMRELHLDFDHLWAEGNIDKLLLIACYVFDFLCIHPFLDGNGRIARLITLLLLYKADYEVGRYISLEKIIENSKEQYYETLNFGSRDWHTNKHDLMPWFEYFVGVVLIQAYQSLESCVNIVTTARGAKTGLVVSMIRKLPARFKLADVRNACPGVSLLTIKRTLEALKEKGEIRCLGKGRDAAWERLKDKQILEEELLEVSKHKASRTILDNRSTDEILGYDESGMPGDN